MWKKIPIAVGVVVLGFVAFVASRPAEFVIERAAFVNAPPEIVYAKINDFRAWDDWSPWAKMDPSQKNTYAGPATGVGSSHAWAGNDQVGQGRMEILESTPAELVKIQLDFIAPMEAHNLTTFTFAKEGEGTKVTWRMEGNNGFVGKAFSLAFNMDKMVGADFEKGLASLDTVAKTAHAAELAAAQAKAAETEAAAEPQDAVALPVP